MPAYLEDEFFGLKLFPHKTYSQTVEVPFRLTMAALDSTIEKEERVSIIARVDEVEYVLCSLIPGTCEQHVLKHLFQEGESVTFSIVGENTVHLTGNFLSLEEDMEDGCGDELCDYDSHDDDDSDLGSQEEDSEFLDSEDDASEGDSDEDSDEDLDLASKKSSKKVSSKIREIIGSNDDENCSSSENDESEVDEDDSDNSVDYENIEFLSESGSDAEIQGSDSEEEDSEDEEIDSEIELAGSSDDDDDESDVPELVNNANGKRAAIPPAAAESKKSKAAPVASRKQADPAVVSSKDTKPQTNAQINNKNKQVQTGKATTAEAPASTKSQTPAVRTVQGVRIEDVGNSNGPKANHGRRVGILYKGTLANGKMFDSNFKSGKPLMFRLGDGSVIKGFDVAVQGMTLNATRKVSIPPHLAYGSKELPGIPRNSTLNFEIKLVKLD